MEPKKPVSNTYLINIVPAVWSILRTICFAMAECNAKYRLAGLVQIDDAFFGGKSRGEGK
ncbi:hypothetical protein D2Q93_04535 [Alicyclobacillaceae bacterium I2511]|nr:hypothetical protein D2Q93_04535 [Alicyclobacillaceae bacterium I2511]